MYEEFTAVRSSGAAGSSYAAQATVLAAWAWTGSETPAWVELSRDPCDTAQRPESERTLDA